MGWATGLYNSFNSDVCVFTGEYAKPGEVHQACERLWCSVHLLGAGPAAAAVGQRLVQRAGPWRWPRREQAPPVQSRSGTRACPGPGSVNAKTLAAAAWRKVRRGPWAPAYAHAYAGRRPPGQESRVAPHCKNTQHVSTSQFGKCQIGKSQFANPHSANPHSQIPIHKYNRQFGPQTY